MQINVSHQPPDCLHLRTRHPESERHTPPARGWGFHRSLTSSEATRQRLRQVCRSARAHNLPRRFVVCL